MSTTTISPLRQRMIEDMSLRNLAPRTQEAYIRGCKKLAAFLRRSPDTATAEDIRLFQLHLAELGVSVCSRNRTMTGVAFLFRVTLRRPEIADQIEYIAEPEKIPLVLSPEEVQRLLDAAPGFKCRLLLSLAYGCAAQGLRYRQRPNGDPYRAGQGPQFDVPPSSSASASRSNPRRARRTVVAHLSRFRPLALFERLPSARWIGSSCRRPKTFTQADECSAAACVRTKLKLFDHLIGTA
jgi:hypothetical protein